MTNMWERGTQRQYLAAAIAVACSSSDHRKLFSWQEQDLLSGAGSPP
ncbi:hypothetical protein [Amycolatopsis sp. NPDC051128]